MVCNYDLLWPSRPSPKVFSTGCQYGLLCSSRSSLTLPTIADLHRPSPSITDRPSLTIATIAIHHWSTITVHRDHRLKTSLRSVFTVCYDHRDLPRPSPTIADHHRPLLIIIVQRRPSPFITDHHDHHLMTSLQTVITVCYDRHDHHRSSLTITDHRDNHLKTSLRSVITVSYDHRDHHLTTSLRTVIMVCYGHRDHHIKTSLRSVFTACLPTPSRSRIGRWTGYLKPILL